MMPQTHRGKTKELRTGKFSARCPHPVLRPGVLSMGKRGAWNRHIAPRLAELRKQPKCLTKCKYITETSSSAKQVISSEYEIQFL